jgi:hypothetical protein
VAELYLLSESLDLEQLLSYNAQAQSVVNLYVAKVDNDLSFTALDCQSI